MDKPKNELRNGTLPEVTNVWRVPHRLFRKAIQQGRSERRGESYSLPYVEPLSEVRTPRVDFVNSLLAIQELSQRATQTRVALWTNAPYRNQMELTRVMNYQPIIDWLIFLGSCLVGISFATPGS